MALTAPVVVGWWSSQAMTITSPGSCLMIWLAPVIMAVAVTMVVSPRPPPSAVKAMTVPMVNPPRRGG
jgi:hypothetical protein